jgi:hypothetical protein
MALPDGAGGRQDDQRDAIVLRTAARLAASEGGSGVYPSSIETGGTTGFQFASEVSKG